MPKHSRPRRGSLQFYPRKRAKKFLHSVNWKTLANSKVTGMLGVIAYKVGMATAVLKDLSDKSMSAKKQIAVPVTILEVPNMKIFSVRFYNQGIPIRDIIVSTDKELKRKLKVPSTKTEFDKMMPKEYEDIKLIIYSLVKQTSVKKSPDLIEIDFKADDKLKFVKELIGKEITYGDLSLGDLVDVRGLTKGKGNQGPVKRFGLKLKFHKSEKGVRRPGSLAPWHPTRVTFRTPMAGQLGLFSRIIYNLKVLNSGRISEKDINPSQGFSNYGRIKNSYVVIKGSVVGPTKRQVVITPAFRPSKEQLKKKFEFLELVTK